MFMPYVVGALVGIVIGAALSWKQISDLQKTIRFRSIASASSKPPTHATDSKP